MKTDTHTDTIVARQKTKMNVLISIDKELYERFKQIADKYRRKYSSIVEQSIERYVLSKE